MQTLKVLGNENCIIYVRPDMSSFYFSNINLFLINYSWCKLCSKWLLFMIVKNDAKLEEEFTFCFKIGMMTLTNVDLNTQKV